MDELYNKYDYISIDGLIFMPGIFCLPVKNFTYFRDFFAR